ncbi:type I restriction endonuclease subunit R [Streptomyces sp. NPDC020845]|uniref:type I restriction endonuclease subunit R n=1 Tax=Streptomyces sp. NPDC020845 TaxID=3365096 RepID=UPI0037A8D75B
MGQPEYEMVERPLIGQLVAMGWAHLQGAPPGEPAHHPEASERHSFAQVVYEDRFREVVRRINPGPDGEPWLSDAQLNQILAIVLGTAPGYAERGVAGNLAVTDLLRNGIPSRILLGWHKELPETVRLVDWDGECDPGNDFLAVSQFRVERRGEDSLTPDLVLFVNGLPWVVIECKAPSPLGLDLAVDQVLDAAGAAAEAPVAEFVRFGQILIGTDRESAQLGTVTAEPKHFAYWRTVAPATEAQVRDEVGKPDRKHDLTAQEVLAAGVLRPAHLLSLVRDFTTTAGQGPRTVKLVARYPQFRAVHELARTLRARKRTLAADKDPGHRAGVVWHTQGSGKSLTMAFLVRCLRSDPELAGHKVVVITDRIDLERQITGSLVSASDESVHRSSNVNQARQYLAVDVPDLVLVTVQKARKDDDADDGSEEKLSESPEEQKIHNRVANPGHEIVVLVDEAHRSHGSWQHARLRAMLPNAAMVGFTGTPIISGAAKRTREIFGDFADTYTLRDAETDGAVVPVRYEAYSVPMEVVRQAVLDAEFDEQVPADPEQREKVLRRFARRKEILEAPSVIGAKAAHMLRHWAKTAMPDGFGAQVVTVSRLAAVRYREALLAARDGLLAELEAIEPDLAYDPMAHEYLTEEQQELLYLLPHRALLASIDAAVVISEAASGRKDPKEWRAWTARSHQQEHIERFKRGTDAVRGQAPAEPWEAETHGAPSWNPGPGAGGGTAVGEAWHQEKPAAEREEAEAPKGSEVSEPLAFLVVKSMLLTGFDAPVEQVLYLDRAISGVELLQAIARTNRPYPAKEWGQVVDYVGIGPELGKALGEYDTAHLREVYGYQQPTVEHLQEDYRGEQPTSERPWLQTDAAADELLRDLHSKVQGFVTAHSGGSLTDDRQREDLLAELADPLLRAEFDSLVRDFLTALNAVLPRPEALKYEDVARQLGVVQYLVRRRYLDGHDQFSPRRYGAKVRGLISRHLAVSGIQVRIPPVKITEPDFMEKVRANTDPRARTSYMAGSLRLHITARLRSDPVVYERFSARLEKIVQSMTEDFDRAASAMAELVAEVEAHEGEATGDDGPRLDPWTEAPVYRTLVRALEEAGQVPGPEGVDLMWAAQLLSADIAELVRPPQFPTLPAAQNRVRRQLRQRLEERFSLDWDVTGPLAGQLLDLALSRREDFLRYGSPGQR